MDTIFPHRCTAWIISGFLILVTCLTHAQSERTFQEKIAVRGRPARDSIVLRWAPTTYNIWRAGNVSGYRIERQVMVRNGNLVNPPEKTVLDSAVLPWQEARWENLVRNDQYAAIVAQALYGERFEVDLGKGDIFTIVNKVRENDQRFSFALFCADMSAIAATASGLSYVDKTVISGERYLYRIIANSSDSLRGSTYLGPDDSYLLPIPQNLHAEFKDVVVHLKWDRLELSPYSAFAVERSSDGITFRNISNTPLVTISPGVNEDNRYEYAMDSLPDPHRTWHYRVKGITPFGDQGPPSGVVSGRGTESVEDVPYITSAMSVDNATIRLEWDFPEISNGAIKGFSIERAGAPSQKYTSLTREMLDPDRRTFEDPMPDNVNYYRVRAHGLDGQIYSSHVYFASLIDSLPPARPTGLIAVTNDSGDVRLSWDPNTEKDLYGYRVYKAYYTSEEPAQATVAPVTQASFIDHVDLNTLNEYAYYQVMALDASQNHSALSEQLRVQLPDKVKPLAPVMLPPYSDAVSITITWTPSGSSDVTLYRVYRKTPTADQWGLIGTVPSQTDSVLSYVDQTAAPGTQNDYTVVSVDDAGLESEPALPVLAMRSTLVLRAPIKWRKAALNREDNRIELSWVYDRPDVRFFRIFRATDSEPATLLVSVGGGVTHYSDAVAPGHLYSYRVLAVFEDGQQSRLSEELKLDF